MIGAEIGIANATGEITLVLFTTLAPAGALAYLMMLVPLVLNHVTHEQRLQIRKMLWIPLAICMSGLVASATHLGNASNVLYVLTRIGKSPLSTEVASAAIFLIFAALFWLVGFALRRNKIIENLLISAITISGIIFLYETAVVYNVPTIITWKSVLTPITIMLSAFMLAPLITLSCFSFLSLPEKYPRFTRHTYLCSTGAAILWIGAHFYWSSTLSGISNSLLCATDLVPYYIPCVLLSTALIASTEIYLGLTIKRKEPITNKQMIISSVLVASAIFIMRFEFYALHMTVGVAI